MPEIVEVETIKRDLENSKEVLRHKIIDIEVFSNSIIDKNSKNNLNLIKNKTIKNIQRIGKYLVFELDDLYLVVHLRMTGHIFLKDKKYINQKHDHLFLIFENNKKIVYFDPRRFGKFYVKSDLLFLKNLGSDVLSENFIFDEFYENLKTKNKKIKTLLLDQNFIAGLGNIYVDEVLFSAKINPLKLASSLKGAEALNLYNSIKDVVNSALIHRGTSLGKNRSNFSSINEDFGNNQKFLLIHTRKTCPGCKRDVEKIKISQRTSYYCKYCQKL
ncbi:MAG: DNA-formamidopyrimidine glycosylase [Parachlamydiales bacterium]|jgi:formamidopyrimidine-DNA glycosylase